MTWICPVLNNKLIRFFLTSHRIQSKVIVGIWWNNTTRVYVMLGFLWSFITWIYLMPEIQWNNITQNEFNAKNLLKCNITKINLMLKSDKKNHTEFIGTWWTHEITSHRFYLIPETWWNKTTQILPNARNLKK